MDTYQCNTGVQDEEEHVLLKCPISENLRLINHVEQTEPLLNYSIIVR